VDLRQCPYFDSTFLGMFLHLLRSVKRRGEGNFALICPSAECRNILGQMGVMDIFSIEDREDIDPDRWTVLTQENEDRFAFEDNVLQAHEELAHLPGKTGDQFRAVARCLAKDIEGRR
jgi:hypothetical protein